MIRIGVVNIDVSHPSAFAEELLKEDRARYVAVFNDGFRGEDQVKGFAEKFGLEKICDSVEELADYVDVGFIQGCNWDRHLEYAMPFIERNKPVFIDKPMVGNMAECRKLIELEKNGAVILGSSALRYCNEVKDFLNPEPGKEGGLLHADIVVGIDEFNYAIHGVEAICALAQEKPVSVKYLGVSEKGGQKCETYFVKFDGGATACYHSLAGRNVFMNIIVVGEKRCYSVKVDNGALYKALLDELCDKLEGKENNVADMVTLTDSIKVMLAGKCSKENGGKEIALDAPELEETSFDGYAFEEDYASKAKPMFV